MSSRRHGHHGHHGIKALKHAVATAPAAKSTSEDDAENKSVSKSESNDD
jgi:hypothetical protein